MSGGVIEAGALYTKAEARAARDESPLPAEPDRDAAERIVMEIHAESLDLERAAIGEDQP